MKRGNALGRFCAASMLTAAALCLSCGNGIWTKYRMGSGGQEASGGQGGDGGQTGSGGQPSGGSQMGGQAGGGGQAAGGDQAGTGGQVVVSNSFTLDQRGGRIVLGELTLDVWESCLASTATIIVRRYDTIKHTGAIGPVFEIELPSFDTFIKDPQISISTSPDVLTCGSCTVGFLVPGLTPQQWVPDTPPTPPTCMSGVICGPLQVQSFTKPDSTFTTTIVQFAIVKQCGSISDCGSKQACNSGACQQCPTSAACNP